MSDTTHTVLLTGATGFLGSHVAEALVAEGWTVRCTVRKTSNLRWIESLPVDRVTADVRSTAELANALEGVDVVVHSAGLTRAKSDAEYHRVNSEGTQALALAAADAGVRRFVFVSSLAARGPDRRVSDRGVTDDRPTSAYGESKLAGERRLFQVLSEQTGAMEGVILRPGGIYGPRDEDSLNLFKVAKTGMIPVPTGKGRLQPVYVKDVAEAVIRAVARPDVDLKPIPIVGPEIVSWADMGEALGSAVGKPVRLVKIPNPIWQVGGAVAETAARLVGMSPQFDRRTADDLSRLDWTADPREAEASLGWRAATHLREAMEETGRWYRERGWLR
ncbi:NAD-dependent epimerase/dehydratase family protein [Gemmatimonadota bacterium]